MSINRLRGVGPGSRLLLSILLALPVWGQSYTYDFATHWNAATQTGVASYGPFVVSTAATHPFAGQLAVPSLPGLDLQTAPGHTFGTFSLQLSQPADVEVDFWNLTGGSTEVFRAFSSAPGMVSIAPEHVWDGSILSSSVAQVNAISTFTWSGITSLSFESGDSTPGGSTSVQEIALRISVPSPCSQAASQAVRAGSPPNPVALLGGSAGGPVLGSLWDPHVSHQSFVPTAVQDLLAISVGAANVPTPIGTILIDLGTPPFILQGTPGQAFPLPIPSDCLLSGLSFSLQGASIDASGVLHPTNALDVTVGSF